MLVGEQPGDEEDKQGKPFVEPAGKLLDRALREAHIDRGTVYVTNAVKHFMGYLPDVLAAYHPSCLLRILDERDRAEAYAQFVAGLAQAAAHLKGYR
jgi:uracil-DNA glycosylase